MSIFLNAHVIMKKIRWFILIRIIKIENTQWPHFGIKMHNCILCVGQITSVAFVNVRDKHLHMYQF